MQRIVRQLTPKMEEEVQVRYFCVQSICSCIIHVGFSEFEFSMLSLQAPPTALTPPAEPKAVQQSPAPITTVPEPKPVLETPVPITMPQPVQQTSLSIAPRPEPAQETPAPIKTNPEPAHVKETPATITPRPARFPAASKLSQELKVIQDNVLEGVKATAQGQLGKKNPWKKRIR